MMMREMDVEMKIDCTGDWDGMDWMDDEEDDGDGSSIFLIFLRCCFPFPPFGPTFSLIFPHLVSFLLSFLSAFPHPIPHLSVCIGITVTDYY